MGLYKEITTEDGIPLQYHRISAMTITTNYENLVEVMSYTTPDARRAEIVAQAIGGIGMTVFKKKYWYSHEYDQSMTIDDAYSWLKTTETVYNSVPNPFFGAEDYQEDWDIPDPPAPAEPANEEPGGGEAE